MRTGGFDWEKVEHGDGSRGACFSGDQIQSLKLFGMIAKEITMFAE